MQKRAELTSSQIATLILSIAGFIIALVFLLVFLDTQSMSEREICRLSVLTRATAAEALQRLTPLKCTTQKLCLSQGGKCDQFIGEQNVQKVDVPSDEQQAKEILEKQVADSMYDCWSMMGEGKLDVFGGVSQSGDVGIGNALGINRLFKKETVCIICSRLALDSKIKNNSNLLNNVDVNSYIETRQVPGSEKTYLQTFTDQQVRSFPREFRENLTNVSEGKSTDEIAILFMQINNEDSPWEAGVDTGTKMGAFVFASTTGIGPLGILRLKEGLAASAFVAVATGVVAGIQTWRSQNLAASYCGDFTSVSNSRKGCSIVMPINYKDIATINNYCSIIEGQP